MYNYEKLLHENDLINIERLILRNIQFNGYGNFIKQMPYVCYTVRNKDGDTSWQKGWFSHEHNYFIKYHNEYNKAKYYTKCN